MVKFSGASENVTFLLLQFSQYIDGFRQNYLQAFRTHVLYKQNSLEFFFIFSIYPKLCIGFNSSVTLVGMNVIMEMLLGSLAYQNLI